MPPAGLLSYFLFHHADSFFVSASDHHLTMRVNFETEELRALPTGRHQRVSKPTEKIGPHRKFLLFFIRKMNLIFSQLQ